MSKVKEDAVHPPDNTAADQGGAFNIQNKAYTTVLAEIMAAAANRTLEADERQKAYEKDYLAYARYLDREVAAMRKTYESGRAAFEQNAEEALKRLREQERKGTPEEKAEATAKKESLLSIIKEGADTMGESAMRGVGMTPDKILKAASKGGLTGVAAEAFKSFIPKLKANYNAIDMQWEETQKILFQKMKFLNMDKKDAVRNIAELGATKDALKVIFSNFAKSMYANQDYMQVMQQIQLAGVGVIESGMNAVGEIAQGAAGAAYSGIKLDAAKMSADMKEAMLKALKSFNNPKITQLLSVMTGGVEKSANDIGSFMADNLLNNFTNGVYGSLVKAATGQGTLGDAYLHIKQTMSNQFVNQDIFMTFMGKYMHGLKNLDYVNMSSNTKMVIEVAANALDAAAKSKTWMDLGMRLFNDFGSVIIMAFIRKALSFVNSNPAHRESYGVSMSEIGLMFSNSQNPKLRQLGLLCDQLGYHYNNPDAAKRVKYNNDMYRPSLWTMNYHQNTGGLVNPMNNFKQGMSGSYAQHASNIISHTAVTMGHTTGMRQPMSVNEFVNAVAMSVHPSIAYKGASILKRGGSSTSEMSVDTERDTLISELRFAHAIHTIRCFLNRDEGLHDIEIFQLMTIFEHEKASVYVFNAALRTFKTMENLGVNSYPTLRDLAILTQFYKNGIPLIFDKYVFCKEFVEKFIENHHQEEAGSYIIEPVMDACERIIDLMKAPVHSVYAHQQCAHNLDVWWRHPLFRLETTPIQ